MSFERFMLACVFVAMLMVGGGSVFRMLSLDANTALKAASSNAAPSSGSTYIVRSGDTLAGIAQTQLGSADRYTELASLNGIQDAGYIRVGQVIQLP